MDSIGLLAAWTGILSVLFSVLITVAVHFTIPRAQRWLARRNPERVAGRIPAPSANTQREVPDSGYLADLISLYGALILNLIAGTALVIISIEVLDLGPALLAAILPFSLNAKLLTRITGLFLLVGSYVFIFRLSYLVIKLRLRTLPKQMVHARVALQEVANIRPASKPHIENVVGHAAAQPDAN